MKVQGITSLQLDSSTIEDSMCTLGSQNRECLAYSSNILLLLCGYSLFKFHARYDWPAAGWNSRYALEHYGQ